MDQVKSLQLVCWTIESVHITFEWVCIEWRWSECICNFESSSITFTGSEGHRVCQDKRLRLKGLSEVFKPFQILKTKLVRT